WALGVPADRVRGVARQIRRAVRGGREALQSGCATARSGRGAAHSPGARGCSRALRHGTTAPALLVVPSCSCSSSRRSPLMSPLGHRVDWRFTYVSPSADGVDQFCELPWLDSLSRGTDGVHGADGG